MSPGQQVGYQAVTPDDLVCFVGYASAFASGEWDLHRVQRGAYEMAVKAV